MRGDRVSNASVRQAPYDVAGATFGMGVKFGSGKLKLKVSTINGVSLVIVTLDV